MWSVLSEMIRIHRVTKRTSHLLPPKQKSTCSAPRLARHAHGSANENSTTRMPQLRAHVSGTVLQKPIDLPSLPRRCADRAEDSGHHRDDHRTSGDMAGWRLLAHPWLSGSCWAASFSRCGTRVPCARAQEVLAPRFSRSKGRRPGYFPPQVLHPHIHDWTNIERADHSGRSCSPWPASRRAVLAVASAGGRW
jgi:hypothetical protein